MADANLWPPEPFDIAMVRFAEHDAWYTGDTAALQAIYSGKGATPTHTHNGRLYRGGVVGTISKMWLGTPIQQDEKRPKTHVPLASNLCMLSADLLFGEPPKFRYARPDDFDPEVKDGKATKTWKHPGQDRLNIIMGSDETHAELLQSGEYSAALGGAYLSVVWDKDLLDHVWLQAYASDCAIPTFKYGRLVECKLWSEFRPTGSDVYRLIEHQMVGRIAYTLFKGSEKELGEAVPLTSLAETAHYESLLTEAEVLAYADAPETYSYTVTVATGVDALAVVYYPNMMPQRDWRKLGQLANLGRSDLDGIEDTLDKVDQVMTSLIRDVENGAGRITVPESWLEQGPRGEGATFDPDRQVYVGVNALGKSGDTLSGQATISQFDIRVQEHLDTIDGLKREIAAATGYSLAHLGVKDAASGQRTATEVVADFTDSERTRDKKAMYATPALARIAQVALAIDGVVFPAEGGKWFDEQPDVEFAPVSQQDMEKAARIVTAGFLTESMTTRERVKTLHPDWDDEQIDAQVSDLRDEASAKAALVPDPTTFTDDPTTPNGERPKAGENSGPQ